MLRPRGGQGQGQGQGRQVMGNQSTKGLSSSTDKAARTANDVFPLPMVDWVATVFGDMPLRQQVKARLQLKIWFYIV